MGKFKVIKRVEVPRGEYSYDNAINTVVELNEIYNPSWIFCDRGSGEYQIERLHIIGDKNPASNLKNKVVGWQFKNNLEIVDPITGQKTNEPMKPFMVTQLQIAFERDLMVLSPFDEILYKQLIDYEVERVGQGGNPIFTSVNEHYVDALGLAYLAFVLKFKQITNTIKDPQFTSKVEHVHTSLGIKGVNAMFNDLQSSGNNSMKAVLNYDPNELKGDRPSWVKVSENYRSGASGGSSWGSRASGLKGSGGRKSW